MSNGIASLQAAVINVFALLTSRLKATLAAAAFAERPSADRHSAEGSVRSADETLLHELALLMHPLLLRFQLADHVLLSAASVLSLLPLLSSAATRRTPCAGLCSRLFDHLLLGSFAPHEEASDRSSSGSSG